MMRAGTSSVILLCAALLGACNASTAPVSDDYQSLPSDHVLLNIEHFITDSGVRRAHLRADTAYVFEDSMMTQLRVVNLEMFDDEGRLTSTLTSDAGEYSSTTQKTIARGNVILTIPGPDGRTIWTEELHYDPTTKRIWSDVPTRMLTSSGEDLHGGGFTTDDQFSNINIRGGAGTGLQLPIGESR
jgi:LPS export ABC transporter protein LptC